MTTAIDTNILLDYLNPSEPFNESSTQALLEAGRIGPLIICEMVYAEVTGAFLSDEEVRAFLEEADVRLSRSSQAALAKAGSAWVDYTRRRPSGLQCPVCGEDQDVPCRVCGTALRARQHIVADFMIGGHALVHADQLLTRDRGFYRAYFPELRLA